MLVSHLLNHLIRVGSMSVINAYGHTHLFEGSEGPAGTVRLIHRNRPLSPLFSLARPGHFP